VQKKYTSKTRHFPWYFGKNVMCLYKVPKKEFLCKNQNGCRLGFSSNFWDGVSEVKDTKEGSAREGKASAEECDETLKGKKDMGYRGCQDKTVSGRTCQAWSKQSPHTHPNKPSKKKGYGLAGNNYCRNPDGKKTIWCYTTDAKKRFELCKPKKKAAPKLPPTTSRRRDKDAKPPPLKNKGRNCWGPCKGKQGPCTWCGAGGLCCRYGFRKKSGGCDGKIGQKGKGHVCAAKPEDASSSTTTQSTATLSTSGATIALQVDAAQLAIDVAKGQEAKMKAWLKGLEKLPATPVPQGRPGKYSKPTKYFTTKYKACSALKKKALATDQRFSWACVPKATNMIGRLFSEFPWYATRGNVYQWLQVDLGELRIVTGMAVQSNGGCKKLPSWKQKCKSVNKHKCCKLAPMYVKQLTIAYAHDGINFTPLQDKPGHSMVFDLHYSNRGPEYVAKLGQVGTSFRRPPANYYRRRRIRRSRYRRGRRYHGRRWGFALVSQRKPTTQWPGTVASGYSSRAVDGNTNNRFALKSCTHTNRSRNPWWRVDLRRQYSVQKVQVWNRADCCGNRLNGFVVRVGNSGAWSRNGWCGRGRNVRQGGVATVQCRGRRGRFVFVVLQNRTNYLTLCEVRVWARAGYSSYRRRRRRYRSYGYRRRRRRYRSYGYRRRRRVRVVSLPGWRKYSYKYCGGSYGSFLSLASAQRMCAAKGSRTCSFVYNQGCRGGRYQLCRQTKLSQMSYSSSSCLYHNKKKTKKGKNGRILTKAEAIMLSHYGREEQARKVQTWSEKQAEGKYLTPDEFHRQYLQVNLGMVHHITAIATQGDPSTKSWVSQYRLRFSRAEEPEADTWRWYSKNHSATTNITMSSPLPGNDDPTHVKKAYLEKPIQAQWLRIYPECWSGNSMVLRMELYGCLHEFNFSSLVARMRTESKPQCGVILDTSRASFDKWSLGMGGSGAIYQTPSQKLTLGGAGGQLGASPGQGASPGAGGASSYIFKGYQRRQVKGAGLLIKQLMCYKKLSAPIQPKSFGKAQTPNALGGTKTMEATGAQAMGDLKCCVSKRSMKLDVIWTDQELQTTLL
jgi:hypothetical protein